MDNKCLDSDKCIYDANCDKGLLNNASDSWYSPKTGTETASERNWSLKATNVCWSLVVIVILIGWRFCNPTDGRLSECGFDGYEVLHESCQAFFVCLIIDWFCAVLLWCEMKQQGCPGKPFYFFKPIKGFVAMLANVKMSLQYADICTRWCDFFF